MQLRYGGHFQYFKASPRIDAATCGSFTAITRSTSDINSQIYACLEYYYYYLLNQPKSFPESPIVVFECDFVFDCRSDPRPFHSRPIAVSVVQPYGFLESYHSSLRHMAIFVSHQSRRGTMFRSGLRDNSVLQWDNSSHF